MTTIAVKDGVMAADSMVSSSYGRKGRKLRRIGDSVYGIAGNWDDGLKFFRWRAEGVEVPSLDDLNALELRGKQLIYWNSTTPERINPPYAIGSGADIAMGAMAYGASAEEAVRIACKYDDSSGGPVKTMEVE